jgi:sugar phosphate isomerase/epimerase
MKVGAFAIWFGERPFEEALDLFVSVGLQAVEVGTGGFMGNVHCKPSEILADETKLRAFRRSVESRGLVISGLSCSGNPLHPRAEIAEQHQRDFRDSVLLAERLGVAAVGAFAGCPGDSAGARHPNWVTSTFPSEYGEILDWQWNEKVIPYWRKEATFCQEHGIKIAIELHPGFVCYNPSTLLRLREAIGETIGVNFDPSHLWWQQVDPIEAVRELGSAIYHVHAKDIVIDPSNTQRNGVLDLPRGDRILDRPWVFRTVGYGHDAQWWRALISQLRLVGYDHVLSIEPEDPIIAKGEGLAKAARLLTEAMIVDAADAPWWERRTNDRR